MGWRAKYSSQGKAGGKGREREGGKEGKRQKERRAAHSRKWQSTVESKQEDPCFSICFPLHYVPEQSPSGFTWQKAGRILLPRSSLAWEARWHSGRSRVCLDSA